MVNAANVSEDLISHLSVGNTIEGVVVARDRSSLFIDLGINGTGIIYGKEFYLAKDMIRRLKEGDKIVAKIVELENDEGYKELSLKDATKELSWKKLRDLRDNQEVISVKIAGVNKGGLLTMLEGVQAFLPVSQLSAENYPRVADADKQKILRELQKFIGQTLEVKILDLDQHENKLILSEKSKSEGKLQQLLAQYKIGDTIEGEITGVADFGAFIKFPADKPADAKSSSEAKEVEEKIEGLIHISELDWQLVDSPTDVVKVGEIVKAKIIDINKNQVFLSLKVLKENPWEQIEKQYKKGDKIKGKVTQFSSFGAFVEVSPKIRGLCHISEFSSKEEMEQKLKVGSEYTFEVLLIDPKEHRISLKLVQ